jgi:hypothetical protein
MLATFVQAMRWGLFQEGRSLGKVMDEWIAGNRELIRAKLSRLIVVAIIAFIFSRLLRLVSLRVAYGQGVAKWGIAKSF